MLIRTGFLGLLSFLFVLLEEALAQSEAQLVTAEARFSENLSDAERRAEVLRLEHASAMHQMEAEVARLKASAGLGGGEFALLITENANRNVKEGRGLKCQGKHEIIKGKKWKCK